MESMNDDMNTSSREIVKRYDAAPGALPMIRFTPEEFVQANEAWQCNCGPAAIAAACGLTLDDVGGRLSGWPGYMNPSLMVETLKKLRIRFWPSLTVNWGRRAVVRIQWGGPWMLPGVPIGARYQHTHWVASCFAYERVWLFDCNNLFLGLGGWVHAEEWEQKVVPALLEGKKRADGTWSRTHVYEIGGKR